MVKFREISLTSLCELPHLPAGDHGDGGGVAVGVAENAPYVNLVQSGERLGKLMTTTILLS